nr:cytochrome P450 [Sphingomonas sp. CDS-1]
MDSVQDMQNVPKASVKDVNFADPAFLVEPWPELVRLQKEAPVYWSEDRQGWLLTRHADVKAAYADKRFSAARMDQFFRGLSPEVVDDLQAIKKYYAINVSRMDGADHMRIRTLMLKAFNKGSIRKIEGFIAELIQQILDRCEAEREFEFTELVSSKLPTMVIQHLLGLPDDSQGELFKLASTVTAAVAAATPTDQLMLDMEYSIRRLNDVFNELIALREKEPGDDLISTLVHARDGLHRLNHDELLACFHAIIVAGTETTANTLGVGLHKIASDPRLVQRLRDDPDCAYALASDLLRYPGTVKCRTRIAAEDFELHGQSIRKGDLIWIMNAAANVDESVFENPFEINPDRDTRESMAFSPGLHFCIGYHLATLELSEFFKKAFSRFDITIVQDKIEMIPSYVFYGYQSLRVRFEPRK